MNRGNFAEQSLAVLVHNDESPNSDLNAHNDTIIPKTRFRDKHNSCCVQVEANFADFYRVSGLRGVYLASQLAEGVTEESLRPPNLTTLISFNSGATWQPVQGPKTDHEGNPVLGCYQVLSLLFSNLIHSSPILQWAKCPPKSSGADCDLNKVTPVGKVFWI